MVKVGDCVLRYEEDTIRIVKVEGDKKFEGLVFSKSDFLEAVEKLKEWKPAE